MTDLQTLMQRYVAMFNAPDAEARRALIGQVFAPDAVNATRLNQWKGHDALFERVSRSHGVSNVEKGCHFAAHGEPQSHHGVARLPWRMLSIADGAVRAEGMEFLVLNDDGLIVADYQFVPPSIQS